jgi:hypothetical protein
MPAERENDETYELAESLPRAAGASPETLPAPTSSAPQPLAYHSAPQRAIPPADDPETLKNIKIPLALLVAGLLVEVIASVFRETTIAIAMTHVGVDLVATTFFMLIGIFTAAKLRAIDLGKFWPAVLKLAAISVAPAAALDLALPMLRVIPLGIVIGWIGEFVLYFAFLGMLFDLDESDTWYCVWIIFLVRVAFYFGLAAIISHLK